MPKKKETPMKKIIYSRIRPSLKDIWWNAFMVKDCKEWDENNIPFCRSLRDEIPENLITWKQAKEIFRRRIKKHKNFQCNIYICFYIDDFLFDGKNGIWFDYNNAFEIIKHFAGIITPDFSTYADFPLPLKWWNTYRMRAFGFWCSTMGINVINNVRWSKDTLDICFRGIPKNSIVAIGTVASRLKYLKNRGDFEEYLIKMIEVLQPHTILVYGSANYDCFKSLWTSGIKIITYQSRRNTKKDYSGDAYE